jgi:hypothetical protein
MRRGFATSIVLTALFFGHPAIAQYGPEPAPPAPPAPTPPPAPDKTVAVGFTTLNLLRAKGIITDAEFESAMRDLGETVGAKAGESLSLMLSKWSATLYGFAETDLIYDTTQSLNEVPGNAPIAHPDTYAANHSRLMVSIRNSRRGIRIRAPEWHGIRASAMAEMDFLGTQPPTTETATFTSPLFRARHYNLKIETPIVDVLIGQWWSLFGWQPIFFPNSVEIFGLPSMLFARTPQFRVSKTIKTAPINVEFAAALVRPPQKDSGTPEGQAGIRLIVNHWTGVQTVNSTGTQIAPLSVGVSATVRQFSLNEFTAVPKNSIDMTGYGVAGSAFIPVIPGRPDKRGNSLSLTGEFVWGYGISDEYTGLTGGVTQFPATMIPNPTMKMNPTYTPNIDNGMVVFTADGGAHLIQWQTFIVGAQYTLPGLSGRLWVSGNYSRSTSDNAHSYGAATAARSGEDFADANAFFDLTPAVRFGAEYAWFNDHYADGKDATNYRLQISAFYIF